MERRNLSEHKSGQIKKRIVNIVMDSFRTRPMPSGCITENECKHRIELATEIWNQLWDDARWGDERILDNLPRYLAMKIDGDELPPETNKQADYESVMWGVEQAGKVEPDKRLSALSMKSDIIPIIPESRKIWMPN